MEKTLEIHLAEQRQAIADDIVAATAELKSEAKQLGADAYLVTTRTLMIVESLIRKGKP